ncbi:MAG: 5'-nucleotidase C-terminal domain-containing protein [Armatimonadota bacterium]|nr:5'-nucleotidase C-terminal domain-containing protein [Armatimonadota bacterium]MDR7518951.1 5'-nucleotidase C-terminal domain-containing protein [Armatimonadota bacterium]MDR7548578.1 5'-nucleotidase C-terminal domain-containing protein [Armatimonadota bacterium]
MWLCARWHRWLVVAAVLGLLVPPSAAQVPITLTFMHFNDVYQLGPVDGGRAGGLDRLAFEIKRIRAADPEAQLLFPGDLISPSLESSVFNKGAQMIEGTNALGIDAATLGNHEFDHGPDVLQQRLAESTFPWIVTNLYQADFSRVPRTRFVLIKPVRGVVVGYFGLLTRDTLVSSSPGPNIRIVDELGAARGVVPVLQRGGARVIVGVTHLPMALDQRILREVPGIHFIAGGHDHDPMRATVGGALVAKAGSDAKWLGVVRMQVTPEGRVLGLRDELIPITDQTPADPEVAAIVKKYADRLSREMDVVIGRTTVPLDARNVTVRAAEAALGNFIADVMRRAVDAEVAITNGGGIRTNAVFPAGEIRRRDVLAWLPFGNVVVKVRMTGAAIRAALENGVSQVEGLSGRFPQVSGLAFTFSRGRPPGSRVVSVTVGGRPLDPDALYTVATNDFMRRGGDGYETIKSAEVIVDEAGGPVMATVVAQAIQQAGTISPRVEGRITVEP